MSARGRSLSLSRFFAVVVKEFMQMRRDRLTFGILIGIPVAQLIIFGYAINFDPKGLPLAVVRGEESVFTRNVITGLKTSGYFRVLDPPVSAARARVMLATGEAQFALAFPPGFAASVLRGERPQALLEADATDPVATANAIAAASLISADALDRDLPPGLFSDLRRREGAFRLTVHRAFNPEGVTRYNVVPGLLGVVLTLTMVLVTGVAITRERERGTMESLLATPARPVEVIFGKIVPYVIVGYIHVSLILTAAWLLFGVPMVGNIVTLLLVTLIFITANLSVGVTFSTIARNQLQSVQMTFFFFLPSIMLSGFMFPFRGMPGWAQWIGSILPLTHYLRVVRGILLKGLGFMEVTQFLWPMVLFMAVALTVAVIRYRETLD